MKVEKGFFVIFLLIILSLSLPVCLFSAEKLISIEAENTDIVSVLKSIAEQADINLVISESIAGTVTLKLKDIPISKALDAVLKSNNYFCSKKDDIINVYSYEELKQQERFSKIKTRVYTLQHADVADLQRVLLSMKSSRGRIELNEKANQVIVTDTQEKIEEIEIAIERLDQKQILKKYRLMFADAGDIKNKLQKVIPEEKGEIFVDQRTNSIVVKATLVILANVDELIRGWDVQSKQVLIEAKILQVTLNDTLKTGIDWQYLKGKYDLQGNFSHSLSSGGIFQVGMLDRRNYEAILEMLESTSDTDVLSSPRIVVMDGEEASILVGSSEPYIVQQKDIDTGIITTETKFLDVGIKLEVTPTITENNFIIMKIHPEVSSARRVAEIDNALAVDTTEADTTMMVKNENTVILGGLIKDSSTTSIDKVPIIGDIPILGLFFRRDSVQTIKQELVVFITPHIIESETQNEVLKQEARRIEELTKRSFLMRQEIDDYCFSQE